MPRRFFSYAIVAALMAGALLAGSAVAAPPVTISPTTLPGGTVGTAYSQTITVSGRKGPYTLRVTQGSLPTGLTLSPAGTSAATVSGSPSTAGTFPFTVTAVDAAGANAAHVDYSVTIASAPPPPPPPGGTFSISPASLPDATAGSAYSQSIVVTGPGAPYTVRLTQGALPSGLSLSSTGGLSGTPTTAGTSAFTVSAFDNLATYAGFRDYSLTVSGSAPPPPATFSISPSTLPAATAGTAYSQSISVTGPNPPYSVRVTQGSLPAGISLSSGGSLSGTPSSSGSYAFTVSGFDAAGTYAGFRDYTLTVGTSSSSGGGGTTTFSDDFEGTLDSNWVASGDPSQFGFTSGYTGQGYGLTDYASSTGPNGSSQMSAIWFSSNAALARASQGDDSCYDLHLYLPSSYQATTGQWNWLLEWHDDNTTMNACGSNAVSVAVGVYTDYPVVTNAYGNNPRLALRLAGGSCSSPQQQSIELPSNSLQRGHWYDLRFHFVWSTSSTTGLAEWWVDGVQYVSTHFPTLYTRPDGTASWNSFGLYNYRMDANWTATVQYDRVRIGTSQSAVQ